MTDTASQDRTSWTGARSNEPFIIAESEGLGVHVGAVTARLRSLCLGVTLVAMPVVTLALGASGLSGQGDEQDPVLVFGADAGVVLTFVVPDKTDDFERVLNHLRQVLEQSEDPIRRQQAEHWRVFHSSDPGPNGSILYVSFMEPVLKGADYSIAHILEDELPVPLATDLVDTLTATGIVPRPVDLLM